MNMDKKIQKVVIPAGPAIKQLFDAPEARSTFVRYITYIYIVVKASTQSQSEPEALHPLDWLHSRSWWDESVAFSIENFKTKLEEIISPPRVPGQWGLRHVLLYSKDTNSAPKIRNRDYIWKISNWLISWTSHARFGSRKHHFMVPTEKETSKRLTDYDKVDYEKETIPSLPVSPGL